MTTLLLLVCMLAGCGAKKFEVDFDLPADAGSTVRLLYYAADKHSGRMYETACVLNDGKGKVECPAILPAVVFVLSSSGKPAMAFYAERGDRLKVTSDKADPLTWRVNGNRISEEWSEWRLSNEEALRSHDERRVNECVEKYVKAHADSELSLLLLLTTYDRKADPDGFAKLWRMLKGKGADQSLVALVARADQPDMETTLTPGDKLDPFVVRACSGTDTVRPGRPSLLFFWHSGQSGRKAGIDLIRRLSKETTDSSTILLADFCLDHDSISWRQPLAGDSLRRTLRGWMPRGEADSAAIRLGVRRSPFFIVADRKGRIKYRGELPARAEAEFSKVRGSSSK